MGLLHSTFLTPAGSWGALPTQLKSLGHDVLVVDADAAKAPKDYASAAAQQLGPQPVLLIAHGGAGMLVPVVAARRDHGWIQAAVFLDATMPGISGESRLTALRRRRPGEAVDLARHLYDGGTWPDPADPQWSARAVHPRGLAHFTEPIQVPSAGWDFPWAYLRTSGGYEPEAMSAEQSGHPVLRRELGHFAPASAPTTVAADLDALAAALLTA